MNSSSKLLAGFIIGAAVGAAVGYFLNSDKKDEVIDSLKDKVNEWKDKVQRSRQDINDTIEDAIAG